MSSTEARTFRHPPWLSWIVDGGVGVVVVLAFWVTALVRPPGISGKYAVIFGCVLASLILLSVLFRWRFPVAATLVVVLATGTGWTIGATTDPMIAAAWCLYPLALRRRPRALHLVVVGTAVAFALVVAFTSASHGKFGQQPVMALGVLGGGWLLGSVEARRLEATRRATEDRAEVERVRQQSELAREVHDVVGHALTVIRAEADIVRNLSDASEEDLRESLENIERRADHALGEVQSLVRMLRSGEDSGPNVDASTFPALIAAARAAGLEVEAHIDPPDPAAQTTLLVAARIVQEALSNVLRHAAADTCEVAVWGEDRRLIVRVDDDGRGLPRDMDPSIGLLGMRERVENAGGSLTVTNRLEGGVRVLARLPLGASA